MVCVLNRVLNQYIAVNYPGYFDEFSTTLFYFKLINWGLQTHTVIILYTSEFHFIIQKDCIVLLICMSFQWELFKQSLKTSFISRFL